MAAPSVGHRPLDDAQPGALGPAVHGNLLRLRASGPPKDELMLHHGPAYARQSRRARAAARAGPSEDLLGQAVFARVIADDGTTAADPEPFEGNGQGDLELAQLVVHRDTKSLEDTL